MKASVRLGLLGLFIALVATIGVAQGTREVSAQAATGTITIIKAGTACGTFTATTGVAPAPVVAAIPPTVLCPGQTKPVTFTTDLLVPVAVSITDAAIGGTVTSVVCTTVAGAPFPAGVVLLTPTPPAPTVTATITLPPGVLGATCIFTDTSTGGAGATAFTGFKQCTPPTTGAQTFTCVFNVTTLVQIPSGVKLIKTFAGTQPGGGGVVSAVLTGASNAGSNACFGTVIPLSPGAGGQFSSYEVITATDCLPGSTLTVQETLALTGAGIPAGGAPVCETLTVPTTGGGSLPAGTFAPFTACSLPFPAGASTTPVSAVNLGKQCTPPATFTTTQAFTCIFSITLTQGIPGNVKMIKTLTGSTVGTGSSNAGLTGASVIGGTCTAITSPVLLPGAPAAGATVNRYEILTTGSGCAAGTTITIQETLLLLAPGGGDVCETISFPTQAGFTTVNFSSSVVCAGVTLPTQSAAPAATSNIASVTKNCTPQFDGTPASTTTGGSTGQGQVFIFSGQNLACSVAVTSVVGAAAVTTVTANVAGAGTFGTGSTATLSTPTVTAGTATTGAVATFTESFQVTASCTTLSQTISAGGGSFTVSPLQNSVTSGTTTTTRDVFVLAKPGTGGICPTAATAFAQPSLVLACQSNTAASAFGGQIPGPIGAISAVGFGILPSALVCTVTPTPNPAAPGTIEISSLNGALLDASGRVSTNLRIVCGGAADFIPGAQINVNTCAGVQFAVLGSSVGFVELRARYEPSTAAAAAGIRETEVAGSAAFVAPPVSVSLLLDPNPVAVNQTGVATARFNRTFNCSVAVLGATTTGLDLCINPTTGLPISFNIGSALNGTVLYTIDNSAIASFAGALPQVTSTGVLTAGSTTGFNTNANQAAVRCGPFGTTSLPLTVGGFSATGGIGSNAFGSFFGGCESTTVTYRGVNPGATNITATFLPDLPGAFGTNLTGVGGNVAGLIGQFGLAAGSLQSQTRVLEVIGTLPTTKVTLTRGCNNVTPTVSESAAAYGARVTPGGVLVSIFEYQAATNTFRGFSPQAGAPSDLASVTFLRPVFICVSGAAELDQPPVAGPGGVGSGSVSR